MKKQIILFLIILVCITFTLASLSFFVRGNRPLFCTDDAKICPDGSVVSRNPNNNCEFNPCQQEEIEEDRVYCNPEQRNVEACTFEYVPVCGWSDPEKIQCIKYPCASNYGNKCQACANEDVLYYTQGECPAG